MDIMGNGALFDGRAENLYDSLAIPLLFNGTYAVVVWQLGDVFVWHCIGIPAWIVHNPSLQRVLGRYRINVQLSSFAFLFVLGDF